MIERKQRVPFRDFSTLSAEDREMGERAKVDGKVINIFRVLLQHPKLTRAWSKFAGYILSDRQTLAVREREILIYGSDGSTRRHTNGNSTFGSRKRPASVTTRSIGSGKGPRPGGIGKTPR